MKKSEEEFKSEEEKMAAFEMLRKRVHKEMEKEIQDRIQDNSNPTEIELRMGAFIEMIEPQTRNALSEFVRKGYSTESSGFYGDHGEYQAVDGYFEVDEETKQKIEELGAEVLSAEELGFPGYGKKFHTIRFSPEAPDMEQMKDKWDKIAAFLPDKGEIAAPSIHGDTKLIETYAPERSDLVEAIDMRRKEIEAEK
ncbi:hypothetical protein ACFLZY_01485 [Patescibacteria group bacterium]